MKTPRDAGRSVARIDGENGVFSRREPARRETRHFRNYLGTLRNKIG
jgi:hypothetical protein